MSLHDQQKHAPFYFAPVNGVEPSGFVRPMPNFDGLFVFTATDAVLCASGLMSPDRLPGLSALGVCVERMGPAGYTKAIRKAGGVVEIAVSWPYLRRVDQRFCRFMGLLTDPALPLVRGERP
jgi:hypothetical protein